MSCYDVKAWACTAPSGHRPINVCQTAVKGLVLLPSPPAVSAAPPLQQPGITGSSSISPALGQPTQRRTVVIVTMSCSTTIRPLLPPHFPSRTHNRGPNGRVFTSLPSHARDTWASTSYSGLGIASSGRCFIDQLSAGLLSASLLSLEN